MHNFLYKKMLEKRANLDLRYKALENEQEGLFQSPKVELSPPPKNPKPKERKMTQQKGDSRPAYYHEPKTNNPYSPN